MRSLRATRARNGALRGGASAFHSTRPHEGPHFLPADSIRLIVGTCQGNLVQCLQCELVRNIPDPTRLASTFAPPEEKRVRPFDLTPWIDLVAGARFEPATFGL